MVSSGVFVSYRRDDSAGWTGRLYDRASGVLGSDRVFMDVEAIAPGEDFTEAIEEILDRVETVLVVVGPGWLEARDGEGRRRIDDPGDYVRREVEGALVRDLRVVPVLVGGAEMPSEQDLPEGIRTLARRNAVSLRDSHFGADLDQLLDDLRSGPSRGTKGNLPAFGTSFVGREKEQAEVKNLVGDARLVTVTGVGGAGKTRLALRVAHQLGESHPDGVWFVDLATLNDSELLDVTVMTALGLDEQPGRESRDVLRDYLDGKSALLVFDNCEHLVGEVSLLMSDLLMHTSGVRCLATSRESIGVPGEIVFRVAPMSVPGSEVSERSEAVRFDAVRLFEERGRLARPGFQVTDGNAAVVADICRRLDGVPLALELTAARLKAFTVKQILENLEEHFSIVVGRSRTPLPRHQALEATMDWSYGLLDEREQILFRRLSVFRGGFTLEAIQKVCTDDRIDPSSVLELLPSLVDKSLVVVDYGEEAHYRLLETVRHYAWSKLEAGRRSTAIRESHAAYFAQVAEESHNRAHGPGWMDLLEDNHANLRQALSWCLENDPQRGLALAGALRAFWLEGDHLEEGHSWLRRLVDRDPRPSSSRARALLTLGTISENNTRAKALLRESLDMYRTFGPESELAIPLNNLAVLLHQTGEWGEAAEMYAESLEQARKTDRPLTVAHNLAQLLASVEGDHEQASALIRESLDAARDSGSRLWLGSALANHAYVRYLAGDVEGAREAAEEALSLADQLKEVPNLSWKHFAHGVLADLAVETRDLTGASNQIIQALENLLSESNYLASIFGWHICTHLIRWARVEFLKGSLASAATVLGAVDVAANRQGYVFHPETQNVHTETLDRVRSALSPDEYTTAWNRGASMTLQEAFAYALEDKPR